MPNFGQEATAILVYGGGGHGKAVIDLIRTNSLYHLAGIVDDGIPAGRVIMGLPVLGGAAALPDIFKGGVRLAVNAVGGINNPGVRLRVFENLADAGFACPNLVHPSAWVEPSAILEGGVTVLALSYISSEAHIGFGTVINAGVVVSHDCLVGKCVNLSPGALLAGGVTVGDFAQVGMGATINLNLTIGAGARVSNGATVKADVPAGVIVHAGSLWPPREMLPK